MRWFLLKENWDTSTKKENSGIAWIEKNGMGGFLNVSSKGEIGLQFYSGNDFSEGLASVKNADGQWGFINAQGNYVIAPQFTKADTFNHGRAMVHNGNN